MEVNASEYVHSLLAKTRDSCWHKGRELSKGSESKKHKRDQAVTRGWSLSFGSRIAEDWSEQWHGEQESPPDAGQQEECALSVPKTDISGTCYSLVLFKEN